MTLLSDLPDEFTQRVRRAWCRESSADPAWTPDNPALGQCAVTAVLVQRHFGGTLLRAEIDGTGHYWNRLPDGSEVDLTREQFGRTLAELEGEERTVEYVLSFPDTLVRFVALGMRMGTPAPAWAERHTDGACECGSNVVVVAGWGGEVIACLTSGYTVGHCPLAVSNTKEDERG